MTKEVKKIAVIGAGAMGGGIAAQAANAGFEVVLLDKFEGAADKRVAQMKKANPAADPFNAGFMVPENADRVTTGTTDENMDLIADADIVIEAVFERLDIKHEVFRKIHEHAREDAIITSNTSTLQIEHLVEGMPDDFKNRFMNSHFFNPPRFMHLLELIDGADTDPEVYEQMRSFGDEMLGKKVIRAKDTPGFIANRIGVYALFRALDEGIKNGTAVEDIDSIMGPAFGFPKLGMMKLVDAVGVDIIHHVGQNLNDGLHADDHFFEIYQPDMISDMVENGYTGKKGKGGFYRLKTDEDGKVVKNAKGKPVKEVKDLQTGEYRDAQNSDYFKMKIKNYQEFFDKDGGASEFAWPVMRDVILYVLDNAEEIAYDVQSIDEAMRAGYNWKYGPFELLDKFGVRWFTDKIKQEGIEVPALLEKAAGRPFYKELVEYDGLEKTGVKLNVLDFEGNYNPVHREDGVIKLSDIKRGAEPLLSNQSAKLWDIGDGVVCLEFTSKMNSMDPLILKMINDSIKYVNLHREDYKAMVIHNEAPTFSAGANLKLLQIFNQMADNKFTRAIGLSGVLKKQVDRFAEDLVYSGQAVFKAMREAPFPIIGAPMGQPQNKAWGGGCEVLLHCDAVQAGPEQSMGLVEAGVGLLPAWGGSTRYLERSQEAGGDFKGPMQAFMRATMAIADPVNATSTSSQDAKNKLWLREKDGISMNPDRVLADAKAKALDMVDGYEPEKAPTFHLPGKNGKATVRMNADAMYFREDKPSAGVNHVDVGVVDRMADVLSGGEKITRDDINNDHIASNSGSIFEQMRKSEDFEMDVNPSMELTEERMLQLERDNFMTLYHTEATQKRINHILNKGAPLREDVPEPRPEPSELREAFGEGVKLKRKNPDGRPLSGRDEERLKDMARVTGALLWTAKKLKLM